MQHFPHMRVPMGGAGSDAGGGGDLLEDGIYWQSGDASAKLPVTGQGWLLTNNLQDGLSGNTGSRETGTSASITVLHVHTASPYQIASWAITMKWKGDLGTPTTFYEGDGTQWSELANGSPAPFTHADYTDEQWSVIFFAGATSKGYHMAVATETDTSGGFMSCSDSRPSA